MQNIVALVLALCVLVFFVAGTITPLLIPNYTPSAEVITGWSDIAKVLIGGLVGYIMPRGSDK